MADAPQVVPGQPMSEEQKRNMATFNAQETEAAHKMAADRRAQDAMNEPPLVQALSESIKDKLKALPPEEGGNIAPTS